MVARRKGEAMVRSSFIIEVIRSVLNFKLFHDKISKAPKSIKKHLSGKN